MQEALKEIIAFAAKSMNIKRIDAVIYVENPKSISVVERLGFSFDGKIKNEILEIRVFTSYLFDLLHKISIILVFDCAMLLFPESAGFTKDDNLFTYQAKILRQLAEKGSCVLIGRCADHG